jgi:hypothetical protein
VADAVPPQLAGKGKRVAGVFVFMIGASIILDTHAVWIGLPILAIGMVVFAWSIVETRAAEPLASPASDVSTESS